LFFRSVGVVGWAYRSAFALFFRHRIWLPFLAIALCQGVILFFLVSFYRPGLIPVMLPAVRALGGEPATHYPFFFFYLPMIFSKLMLLFTAVGASLALGAATLLFAGEFGYRSGKSAWGHAARRYPTLFVVTACFAAAVYGVSQLSLLVPRDLIQESRIARWATRGALVFLLIVVQALVAYTTAWIVLRGHRVLTALRDSIRVTVRTLVPTLLIVAVPIVFLFPLDYVLDRPDLFATKLNPETTVGILGVRIVADMILSFLLVGAVTRLFMWRVETVQ
jgi:hypothetical protein